MTLFLFLFLVPGTVLAQEEREVHTQEQFWWSINSHTRVTDKFGVIADFHLRRTDFLQRTNFYFIRSAASWRLSEQLFVAAGYGHLWLSKNFPHASGIYQDENRIYQQIQGITRLGDRISVLGRFMNEQRWHEVLDQEGYHERTRFSNRVRLLSSVTLRVFNDPRLPSLVVSDEIMFQFGKEVRKNTFDQNRLFTGIKLPLAKNLKFDFGYMMVYQQHADGYTYDLNHTLRWFFFYAPDLR